MILKGAAEHNDQLLTEINCTSPSSDSVRGWNLFLSCTACSLVDGRYAFSYQWQVPVVVTRWSSLSSLSLYDGWSTSCGHACNQPTSQWKMAWMTRKNFPEKLNYDLICTFVRWMSHHDHINQTTSKKYVLLVERVHAFPAIHFKMESLRLELHSRSKWMKIIFAQSVTYYEK